MAAALLAPAAFSQDFTQADLEAMVKELDSVMPRDPKLEYPIKCWIEVDPTVNAFATMEKQEGKNPRAALAVNTGLVAEVKGDKRIIRAVLAHEVAHLSAGHVSGFHFVAEDLEVLYTRQKEYDADMLGAAALQRLGHSKKDAVDMLMMLEGLNDRKGWWFENLTADHADPKERAVQIMDNPSVMKSLLSFDTGLAFADSRRWALAQRFFEEALKQEPKLKEAHVNAAQCTLIYYYDLLPFDVREAWLRVDFGPLLTKPSISARGNVVTDGDRKRYQTAVSRIQSASVAVPDSTRLKELLAIAQVLEPDGNRDVVAKGVAALKALSTTDAWDKIRYANNAAVGLHRLGDLDSGYALLIAAHRGNEAFVPAAAENLGRIRVSSRSKTDEEIACDQMYTFLLYANAAAPYRDAVVKAYEDSCKTLGIAPKKIEPVPGVFARATTIWVGNNELPIFESLEALENILGKPDARLFYDERYKDLLEVRWAASDLTIMSERGKAMRFTTYSPGSRIFLMTRDNSVSGGFNIKVGMSKADFEKIAPLRLATPKKLIRGGSMEEWSYFVGSGFAVLIKDDKVAGLTVSPTVYEDPE